MRAETQGAVCHKFFTVRPWEIAPPLLTPGERCTVSLAVGCTFPAGLPQAVESGQTMNITPYKQRSPRRKVNLLRGLRILVSC